VVICFSMREPMMRASIAVNLMFMREVYWAVSRRLIFLCAFVLLAAALLFVPLPIPPTYAGRTLENAGHTPLFLIATLSVLFVLRHDLRIGGARSYALAGLIGVGAGLLSEVIQQPLRRDASWEDVFADAVGVVCALALFALFDRRAAIGKGTRLAAAALALVCIVMYFEPIVSMGRAYLHRNGQFPMLADFSSSTELYWVVGYGVNRDIVRGALEVEFDADTFPGLSLHEPMPDWSGFKTLVIDVENPETVPLYLGVRVHDRRHGKTYNDRFNRRFDLAGSERRELRIALDDIRHAPRERLMDMAHISDITLLRSGKTGSRRVRIYSVRLQ
jgi:VanZ family protein